MKIVSWNINSIKARLSHVLKYLEDEKPDILMIQELKGVDFPDDKFTALDYQSRAVVQKAYNGVAILSRHDFEVIHTALPGMEEDGQARYIEIEVEDMRLINIYLPNGNPVPSEKYDYKLRWMGHLKNRLQALRHDTIPFAIGGDFNVMPEDKDCHDPKAWEGDALIRPESRQAYRRLLHLGLTECYRALHPTTQAYTFWDYQAGAWDRNAGIRIDHFLLSPELADKLESCEIHKNPRGWDKPSDHTPIMIKIAA